MKPLEFSEAVTETNDLSEVVSLCIDTVEIVKLASPTLAGQKRKYSDLRANYRNPEALALAKSLAWNHEISRESFADNILEAITHKAWKADTVTLKAAIVLSLVKLSPTEHRDYQANQARTSEAAQMEGVAVENPTDYIEKARELIKSRHYTWNIIGLAALTGRRVYEIGCQAEFEKVAPATVAFSGRAKNANAKDESALIPTLAPADEIIEALNSLRAKRADLVGITDKAFNDKASKTLHEVARKKLGISKPKDTRGIYAAICYTGINKRRSGQNAYYTRVLAHDEKGLNAREYQKFYVPDEFIGEITAYCDNLIDG